ncbi:MAG: outer membrane beta-barrel protein [Woeseiaceae bacterium]|nr:outer membrane beta-barrel protein [Woeseiaceae bacterium]NIP20388.1 outer membrane beta-barrel protein [Woeseiaceae bacterium]NIS89278.1 outer membrane beta-barrel protein [Woeseiaceae bacterium]
MNKLTALFGAAMLLAGTANAEGFYVGGSFGAGDATLTTNTQIGDVDLSDRLYFAKGFGGYRVNDYFAVEGSLVGASNSDFDDAFDEDTDATFSAVTGSFLGIIPADENFHLYARVGGYLGESDVGNSFFFFGSGNDEDESGLVWGAGMFINFGPRNQFTIRVDYENFDTDVFDDLWGVTAGFQYNFR